MDITVSYIQQKFDEFNRLMFGGKLPPLPIKLSNARTFLGMCSCKGRRRLDGRVEKYDFTLRISTRFNLSEAELEDTIIHEMIHYYIGFHQMRDSSAHGQIFRRMMNEINVKFGRHISISHKSTQLEREQPADQRKRWHVVAVVLFDDGRQGIKVLPRVEPSILKYFNAVRRAQGVVFINFFMSNDVFFNHFPCSSSFKVHFVSPAEIEAHLVGAKRLECDGKSVKICD